MIDKDRDTAIRIHRRLSVACHVKDFKRCHCACSKLPTVYARGAIDARLASAGFLPRLTSYSRCATY